MWVFSGIISSSLEIAFSGVAKMQNVYPTPMMEKWIDAAAVSANLTSADTKADEAADILKYFASYLIEVKVDTKDADKGPYHTTPH